MPTTAEPQAQISMHHSSEGSTSSVHRSSAAYLPTDRRLGKQPMVGPSQPEKTNQTAYAQQPVSSRYHQRSGTSGDIRSRQARVKWGIRRERQRACACAFLAVKAPLKHESQKFLVYTKRWMPGEG